jgi:hypothetical protein
LCRDGEGRTRQVIDRNGRKLVYLSDPVAGENWVLDNERKTARRIRAPGGPDMAGDLAVLRERAMAAADRALAAAGKSPRAAPPSLPGIGARAADAPGTAPTGGDLAWRR